MPLIRTRIEVDPDPARSIANRLDAAAAAIDELVAELPDVRKHAGLSRAVFAEEARLTPSVLAAIETRERRPSLSEAVALVEAVLHVLDVVGRLDPDTLAEHDEARSDG